MSPCTCHPDDNPPVPCAEKYALTECTAEQRRDNEWRAAHPVLWRIRNFIYWSGWWHQ